MLKPVRCFQSLLPAGRGLLGMVLGLSACLTPLASAQTTVAEKPEFRQLVPEDAAVVKLLGGFRFLEGPSWNPATGSLVFSDTPANRLYRFDSTGGKAEVFREPSEQANGNFRDAAGTLYTCEHGTQRVTFQREGGPVEILVTRCEDKTFNSPNDVVVKRDGTIWFTDPTYGLGKRPREQPATRVYCVDPRTRKARPVADGFDQPNGLCFSPDEKRLYVADSGPPHNVRVFDVGKDNQLGNDRVFCAIDKGVPDGMRCDREGNLFSTSEVGVQVFNPAGERLGVIPVPETPANVCFGGPDGRDLYITARTSLYRIRLATAGAGQPR